MCPMRFGRGGSAGGRGGGAGPGGTCVCPNCGRETAHQRGTPCTSQKCPNCGQAMVRK
jgi:hypothetical protein